MYQDERLEWRALAAFIESPEFVNRVTADVFTEDRIPLFTAMQSAYSAHGTVTYEGVRHFYKRELPGELLAASGGNPHALVPELARMARKRQLHILWQEIKGLAESFDPEEDIIRNALDFTPIMAEQDSGLAYGSQQFLGQLHAKVSGEYKFATTGLSVLDNAMGGEWKPSALVIVMGSPGDGKTTLVIDSMLRMASHVDKETGEVSPVPSALFSLEMTKADLITKWCANRLSIDSKYIQAGKITAQQMTAIENETVKLQKLPMYVIDTAEITLPQIFYEAKKLVTQKQVRVIFLDYLQILNYAPTGNKNHDLGSAVNLMKAFAKRFGITFVVLSQITESKSGVWQARDSGEVPAIADVIFRIQRTDGEATIGPLVNVEINWAKNRFGPLGTSAALFNGPYQRFEDGIS